LAGATLAVDAGETPGDGVRQAPRQPMRTMRRTTSGNQRRNLSESESFRSPPLVCGGRVRERGRRVPRLARLAL